MVTTPWMRSLINDVLWRRFIFFSISHIPSFYSILFYNFCMLYHLFFHSLFDTFVFQLHTVLISVSLHTLFRSLRYAL